jgi:hypothetical protein
MLDTYPSDAKLLQYKSPGQAFDAYSRPKDGETFINRKTRDHINDHMERRGLSNTAWEGGYDDIPSDGHTITAESWDLPDKAERDRLKQKMIEENSMLEDQTP